MQPLKSLAINASLVAFSVLVAVLSSAPFTPAVVLAPPLFLLGLYLAFNKARTTGLILIFWSLSAMVLFTTNMRFEYLIVSGLIVTIGLAIGGALRKPTP